MTYTLTSGPGVSRDVDGAFIPDDPRNSDWQAYRAWVEEGNAPAPYIAPAPPVPDQVSNYQARAALIGAGIFDTVDGAVRKSGNQLAIAAWDHAQVINRQSPFIDALKGAAALTDTEIDQLFAAAAAVT